MSSLSRNVKLEMNRHKTSIQNQKRRCAILISEGFAPDKAKILSQKQIRNGAVCYMRKTRLEMIDFAVQQGWSSSKAIDLINEIQTDSLHKLNIKSKEKKTKKTFHTIKEDHANTEEMI